MPSLVTLCPKEYCIIMKSTWEKHNKGTLGQPSHRSLLVSPGGGGTDGEKIGTHLS